MAEDPYRFFRIEAAELSDELSRGVLALCQGAPAEHVPRLLRAAHTLKGAARVVRHRGLAERAHALEELLSPLRDRSESPARDAADALLAAVDAIGALVRELSPGPAPAAPAKVAREELSPPAVDAAELDELSDGLSETSLQIRAVRTAAGALERMHSLAALLSSQIERAIFAEVSGAASQVLSKTRSIAAELEDLAEQTGRAVGSGLDHAEKELVAVQGSAERLRLIPAHVIAGALERSAHDAARELGKRVKVVFSGGDVRLDGQLLSQVRSALVQAVRNAVAHGIELSDERARAGKVPDGRVEIGVERRGRLVCFRCLDDGRGMDLDAIRSAAERNGTVPSGAPLDADGLMKLLLKGGISTARAVTETAGRGVGLDVVRETAQKYGGEVSLRTEPGRGTTLELSVPIALSSIEALLVESAGIVVAVPLAAIAGVVRLEPGALIRAEGGDGVVHGGRVIPCHSLTCFVSRKDGASPRSAASAIIVQSARGQAAFAVDRLAGTHEVVVRTLPRLAPAAAVVMGAALDVDGPPRLVLDTDALVAAALGMREVAQEQSAPPALPLLVVDDSLTTRMLEQSILESAGYEVELAASAEEALEKVARRKYGLFLVDVEMPGMSGFEFVARTRSAAIPAILVSSRSSPEDLDRGREVGASAYVVKADFDQRLLLETIRGLVAV